MDEVTTQPAGAPAALDIDRCPRCDGHWFDVGEARYVAPFFANLSRRHLEIKMLGSTTGGIDKCPRCAQNAKETPAALRVFQLADVEVDYCLDCRGLWVDGGEAEGRVALSSATVASGHVYRTVQRSQSLEYVSCAGCGQRVAVAECYMAGVGLVCRLCHLAMLQQQQEMLAARGSIDSDVTHPDVVTTTAVATHHFEAFTLRATEVLDALLLMVTNAASPKE